MRLHWSCIHDCFSHQVLTQVFRVAPEITSGCMIDNSGLPLGYPNKVFIPHHNGSQVRGVDSNIKYGI